MLDLFVVADAVRQKTRETINAEVPEKDQRRRSRHPRRVVRSTSAAALRGLAELIEPSRTGAVG